MASASKTTTRIGSPIGEQVELSIRWDNHICLPFGQQRREQFRDLERHRRAGFNIAAVNIGYAGRTWAEHIDFARDLSEWIAENEQGFLLVRDVAGIHEAIDSDRLGVFYDVEGADLLERNLDRVETLQEIGVRWMCLTYNVENALVGGCSPDSRNGRLTDFGREVIREMNRVGIIVCCSHTGQNSVRQIIEWSEKPTIFSHSNCRQVFGHWRNVDDELIKACADKGGVICVNGVGPFLSEPPYDSLVDKLLDHIAHLADVVGIEHIGIGLDYVYDQDELAEILKQQTVLFGGAENAPTAFEFIAPEQAAAIERGLRIRDFSDDDIEKIFGANLLRVCHDTWRASA